MFKYKKDTDVSLGDKLSKLSLHSIKKKSSRIKVREHVSKLICSEIRYKILELLFFPKAVVLLSQGQITVPVSNLLFKVI